MNVRIILRYIFLITGTFLFAPLFAPLFAQNPQIGLQSGIAWDKQQVEAAVSLDLPSAGISLPTGRAQAEEILDTEFPRLIQEPLSSLLIDSSNTLRDFINRNEYSLFNLSNAALSADRFPPSLSLDMRSMTSRYTIYLKDIRSHLIKHRTAVEIPQTLNPVPSRAYTGIVIFADTELPIHGRQSRAYPVPCMFPKIWDSEMNLLFERNMVHPETAKNQGIVTYVNSDAVFRAVPSGMDDALIRLVGNNPLRIIAQGVFGANPTDPVINREDALIIMSHEENRKLLQEGKVVIVLNGSTLRKNSASEQK